MLLRQTSRSQAPLAVEQLALPYDLPSTSTGLYPESGAGSSPARQVIGSLPQLSQLKPWEAAARSTYKGPIMGGRSQEARYLQQERQQPDSVLQRQESPSSFYRHPHTMVMLPLLPWQPPTLHTFCDSCGQPQRAADKHPPHCCLTCRSPNLSAEGHLIQHALNLVSPSDRQLAAGIPQQTSFPPHTHTHADRLRGREQRDCPPHVWDRHAAQV